MRSSRVGERCGNCPERDAVCPYMLWRSGCPVADATGDELARHVAVVRRQLGFAGSKPSPTAGEIVAIELCDFRRSDCGCLSKPATCLQGGYPAVVEIADCLACVGPSIDESPISPR